MNEHASFEDYIKAIEKNYHYKIGAKAILELRLKYNLLLKPEPLEEF